MHPFICHKIPFVCYTNPSVSPFIGYKLPFVGYKGFTLIELIITLTIAGILLAVAAPNVSNFIMDQRLSGQANDLVADLNIARSEAIKRGANVTLCKQDSSISTPQCDTNTANAWSSGRVVFVDSAIAPEPDGLIDTGETVVRNQQALTGNNTLTTSTVDTTTSATLATNTVANLVVFTGSGLTTIKAGNEGWFRFCDSRGTSKAITVMVNSTGRIRTNRTPPAACP